MKKFAIILIILLLSYPVKAEIITGEVEYRENVEQYGILAPSNRTINRGLETKLFDNQYSENKNYILEGITELKDRKLAKFDDGSYGIQFYDDPLFSWYYSSNGKLISFTKRDSLTYPCKFTKFLPDGNVANIGYRVSEKESFIYSPSGKLVAHWIENNCYDKNNNLIMTRKIYN